MNDFLSQFENKNYKNDNKTNKTSDDIKTETTIPEKKRKEVNGIKSDEHDIVIDTSYNKNKTIRYIVIAVAALLLCVMAFFAYRMINSVNVLNFVDKNVSEARTWGLKNKIELDIQYVFSTEKSSEIVLSQDIESRTTIQKGSIITLTVSKGADPDENIKLPDFSEMQTSQIRAWIDENKAYNTSVIQEYSKTVEVNSFIRREFRDIEVNEDNFRRRDYLNIYVSRGEEIQHKNIVVPDFKQKSKAEVETWADTNDIIVTYKEVTSDTVMEGLVVSQSVAKDELLSKKDKITINISIGKSVKVPNFSNITIDKAATVEPDLNVNIVTRYNNTILYGRLISQSVKPNVYLSGKNKNVTVVYSEGKPFIDDLRGRLEKDIPEYFYEFTKKGATITYKIVYVDSSKDKGTIVWLSKYNEFVNVTTNVEIHVSKGNMDID